MIIEGEWRETSLAFIDFIKINYKSYAYFVMNINMIQQAINDNYKIIYSSYGEKNIKKQMGYMIENYACVMPKN